MKFCEPGYIRAARREHIRHHTMTSVKSTPFFQSILSAQAEKPQVSQGVIVANARYDRHFINWLLRNAARKDDEHNKFFVPPTVPTEAARELYNVCQREMAMTVLEPFQAPLRRASPAQNRGELHVITSLCSAAVLAPGARSTASNEEQSAVKENYVEFMRQQYAFVGFSLAHHSYEDRLLKSAAEQIPVLISGSVTVLNNGPWTIYVGDRLLWDIPHLDADEQGAAEAPRKVPLRVPEGVPSKKMCFWLKPERLEPVNDAEALVDELLEDSTGPFAVAVEKLRRAGDWAAFQAELIPLLECWTNVRMGRLRRYVGVALKGAAPGESLEILVRGGLC